MADKPNRTPEQCLNGVLAEIMERPEEVCETVKAIHGEAAALFVMAWFHEANFQLKVCSLNHTYGVHPIAHDFLHMLGAEAISNSMVVAKHVTGLSGEVIQELYGMAFKLATSRVESEKKIPSILKELLKKD
jgi:hypothetical protein